MCFESYFREEPNFFGSRLHKVEHSEVDECRDGAPEMLQPPVADQRCRGERGGLQRV